MTLRRRLDRLAAKAPPPINEGPTEVFLIGICPERKEAVSAYTMLGGQTFEREEGESEAEFRARFDGTGMVSTKL